MFIPKIFPHFALLKASAGSGKTYALARRFVLFLLSDQIFKSNLSNILAITFSNNAAREMKERILALLKDISIGNTESEEEFCQVLLIPNSDLRLRALQIIDRILSNYEDFQVKTIDSFTTSVFKASAIDFGYSPDFEVVMNNSILMKNAFMTFMRKVKEGSNEYRLMSAVVDLIMENLQGDAFFPWEPSNIILREIEDIYRKIASYGKPLQIVNRSSSLEEIKRQISTTLEVIENFIRVSGLSVAKNSSFENILSSVRTGNFRELVGKGMKAPPVCKPKSKVDTDSYLNIMDSWKALSRLVIIYTRMFAKTYYLPYLMAYNGFSGILEKIKRHEGKVFIEDINSHLANYITRDMVPDIYLCLGETICHYLIDEFQDTSPIQWKNLLPLLENSLAQGGSLFVVGDTKQAIYGFRDADYRIMMNAQKFNPFPSAHHEVHELGRNYRSDGNIVYFTENIFQKIVATREKYVDAASATGLVDYKQDVKTERLKSGYVRTYLVERNDEEEPEKEKLYNVIADLLCRGYQYKDITILAQKNSDVVNVTKWLNARMIPFVSYSGLDVRMRKITGEIVHLLKFLDSPVDDLSFATFILGKIFSKVLEANKETVRLEHLHTMCFQNGNNERRPLYKAFQETMNSLWMKYFDSLFRSSGYLPLYDLVIEAYSKFDLFNLFRDSEEGVLVKILEVIRNFESEGGSSLHAFLDYASLGVDQNNDWSIGIPSSIDAVKVMTIHKSKGLGFPIAIVLLYGDKGKGFKHILKEDENYVELIRLTKAIASIDKEFEEIYLQEEIKELANRLNSLYVAFTRAGRELHIIGVKRERDTFPFNVLPWDESQLWGHPTLREEENVQKYNSETAFHSIARTTMISNIKGPISFEERRRGELVHNVLSNLDYIDDGTTMILSTAFEKLFCQSDLEPYLHDDLVTKTIRLLENEVIRRFFYRQANREIKIEWEVADKYGRLFRVDRVVVDPDQVTIIEYKTGDEVSNRVGHITQVENYLSIISPLYPQKRVQGILCYIDSGSIIELSSSNQPFNCSLK